METIKDTLSKGLEKASDSLKSASPSGEFPKPHEFPTQTQHGRVVGIESEMKPLPHYKTMEADGGFADYKPAGKLVGKKAIITGGDSGIGRAVAVMYAMEGADVAIVYLPEEEGDAQLVKQVVEKYGRRCLCIPKDISVEDNCRAIVLQVLAAFGTIDVLVNNASVMYSQESITDITTEQFDRTVKTNVYGTFFMTKYVVPHLKRGASIIQTTSQVAYTGVGTILDYSMTKSAMLGLTRALANQLLEKGIRVNSVAPGPVWTPLQPAAMTAEQLDKWQKEPAPIGRIGQPSECGPAYVFLASNDASFITGQSIHVNGGCIVNG